MTLSSASEAILMVHGASFCILDIKITKRSISHISVILNYKLKKCQAKAKLQITLNIR